MYVCAVHLTASAEQQEEWPLCLYNKFLQQEAVYKGLLKIFILQDTLLNAQPVASAAAAADAAAAAF